LLNDGIGNTTLLKLNNLEELGSQQSQEDEISAFFADPDEELG